MNKPIRYPIDNVDLCANEVRVSAAGLKKLAEIAAFRSRCDCENALRETQEIIGFNVDARRFIHAAAEAERLTYAAQDLAHSLRFLHAFDSLAKGERTDLNLHPQR
jgi:hypothetical protein